MAYLINAILKLFFVLALIPLILTNLMVLPKFSWSSCSDSPIQIQEIKIEPDPVLIPGNLSLAFIVNVSTDLEPNLKLSLKVSKKTGWVWIPILCENRIGSCNYNDACDTFKNFSICPQAFVKNHIPCECPINKGTYKLPLSFIGLVKKNHFSNWFQDGKYFVQAKLTNESNELYLCLKIFFQLKTVQDGKKRLIDKILEKIY